MNLSRFFVQTEAQGTLTPGAPLVRGNNQVGLPARRTNMPNTTKVANIRIEDIQQWTDYIPGPDDQLSLRIISRHGAPLAFGFTELLNEQQAKDIPNDFLGMRLSPRAIEDPDLSYVRPIMGPDGTEVSFSYVHGVFTRLHPSDYGLEYGGGFIDVSNGTVGNPTSTSRFLVPLGDDSENMNMFGGSQGNGIETLSDALVSIVFGSGSNYLPELGTLEMTIFGA